MFISLRAVTEVLVWPAFFGYYTSYIQEVKT